MLAAHGSDHDPAVNARIREYARALAERGRFEPVLAAFHQGSPRFSAVLDQVDCDEVIVVPVMTSAGYYGDVVLPRELAKSAAYAGKRVSCTAPIGMHPGIVLVIAERAKRLMEENGFNSSDTTVALVGHGTPRHPRSRNSTLDAAEALAGRNICRQVVRAFLDDDPPVESLLRRVVGRNLVVIPFLISDGPHTTQDIPRRLGAGVGDVPASVRDDAGDISSAPSGRTRSCSPGSTGSVRPERTPPVATALRPSGAGGMRNAEFRMRNEELRVQNGAGPYTRCIVDSAVGTDPRIVDLIAEIAAEAANATAEVRS